MGSTACREELHTFRVDLPALFFLSGNTASNIAICDIPGFFVILNPEKFTVKTMYCCGLLRSVSHSAFLLPPAMMPSPEAKQILAP